MIRKKRFFLAFTLLLCVCLIFCACTPTQPSDTPSDDELALTVTGADSGTGTQADPYLLAIEYGGSRTLTVKAEHTDETPVAKVAEGTAVTAELSGETLTVAAAQSGTATVTVTLGDIVKYVRATVGEKPSVTFALLGLEGAGTEEDPYLLSLPFGENAEIEYTLENAASLPTAETQSEAVEIRVAEDAITVISADIGTASVKLTADGVSLWLRVTVWDNSNAVTGTVAKYGDTVQVYAGVTVVLRSDSYVAYSVTGEDGAYWFTHLEAEDYTVTLLLEDDYADYVSDAASKAVSGQSFGTAEANLVLCDFTILPKAEAPKTTLTGKVTSGGTPVEGISVVANETQSATTDASGLYTIENVYAFGDIDVVAQAADDSYARYSVTVEAADVAPNGTTECNAELGLPYYDYGIVCGNEECGGYYFRYTRSDNGFEFSFEPYGGTLLGNIELFMDTKESTYERNNTDYFFSTDGKLLTVSTYGGGTPETAEGLAVRVEHNSLGNEIVYLSVPYAFFAAQGADKAVGKDEVVGISLGYKVSSTSVGWIGWVDSLSGGGRMFDNNLYIAPEHPVAYMRIDADNTNYRADANVSVDFSGYQGSFGFGNNRADAFYVNASVTADGVKFDFLTTGNFGGKGETDEFVCVFLDLDGEAQSEIWGFGEKDLLFKLYGDGTIRYKGGSPWWLPTASGVTTLENAFTVNYENAVTTFSVTLTWEMLGIASGTEFGFALREACDTNVDMTLYGTYNEFVYNGQRVADTAAQAGWIRSTSL